MVAINALLLQLSRPMEFIGYTVSEVRQSLADMDAMARLLLLPDTPTAVRPSVGPADAPPSDVNSLELVFLEKGFRSYLPLGLRSGGTGGLWLLSGGVGPCSVTASISLKEPIIKNHFSPLHHQNKNLRIPLFSL